MIVGARRRRQGLGPFIARFLRELGAEVVAELGREDDFDATVASTRPDAVVIATPVGNHAVYLLEALAARLSVLCEKPLVWGAEFPDRDARGLVVNFARERLLLRENVQWPCTLAAFAELHPGVLGRRPRRFEMTLAPLTLGERGLVDSLPHPISLVQALDDFGEALPERIVFDRRSDRLVIGFRLAEIEVEVTLVRTDETPRPAAYAVDGHRAVRRVEPSDYSIVFRDGDRRVPVSDPLRDRLAAFLEELGGIAAGQDPSPDFDIVHRLRILDRLLSAYRRFAVERGRGVD